MEPIIRVSHYTKKYGSFFAVDDISFEVKEGSIFACLGPNGAGKSTMLKSLFTLLEKTSGEMTINGFDVDTEKAEVRNSIGIVFQEQTLDDKMTVRENLEMHGVFYNIPKKEMPERIQFVLTLVDLIEWEHAFISSLSGGMKRRIEIARALLHYPKVLFLDEPTTGLDPQTRNRMWEYILKLQKEKNITIFLTTHYMEEAEICDQVAIIDSGKIVVNDSPENLKKKYTQDTANIQCASPEETQAFKHGLFLHKFDFSQDRKGFFTINVTNIPTFLGFVEPLKHMIQSIEIKTGTMNDVFLEITGKDIREMEKE